MVKRIRRFSRQFVKNRTLAHTVRAFLEKLTGALEQSTVEGEQVILPYSSDLLKLSQYIWSSHLLA